MSRKKIVLSLLKIMIFVATFIDAIYKFMMVDMGSFGKEEKSSVLGKFNIDELIRNREFPSERKTDHFTLS